MKIGIQFAKYDNKIVLYNPDNPKEECSAFLSEQDYGRISEAFDFVMRKEIKISNEIKASNLNKGENK